jgi:predicted metal-dependent peptidase
MNQELLEELFERLRSKLYLRYYYLFDAFQHVQFQLNHENMTPLPQTDGNTIYFPEAYLLTLYIQDEPRLLYAIVHMIFHLIFLHHTQYNHPDNFRLWSIACDLHLFVVLSKIPETQALHNDEQKNILEELFEDITTKSAMMFFDELKTKSNKVIMRLEALFQVDNHDLWFNASNSQSKFSSMSQPQDLNKTLWEDIQSRLRYVVNNGFFTIGALTDNLKQILAVQPKKIDYKSFFMKFMRLKDVLQTNLDEFDYIYYSYGLQRLGNIALLEDYELSSKKTIHHLIIAIDTSGSTFFFKDLITILEDTYALLESVIYKGNSFELTIIQCDVEIKKISIIHHKNELKPLFESFEVIGGGGTSFIPVFDYIREQKLSPDGLLYFTDGLGIYPEIKPPYKTGFVLTQEVTFDLPIWIYKHIIKGDKS